MLTANGCFSSHIQPSTSQLNQMVVSTRPSPKIEALIRGSPHEKDIAADSALHVRARDCYCTTDHNLGALIHNSIHHATDSGPSHAHGPDAGIPRERRGTHH